MHITKLSVSNVRGVTGSWDVGPAAMIIGDNFRGKSALLHAVRLAVFGWTPHPRKETEMPPMRLASGDTMRVDILIDDGRTYTREWIRDKKGSVSCEQRPTDAALAPAIMLDPKVYFDASPAKRMKFVFDSVRLPESDFSMESILAEVKNIKLETNTEATEQALKNTVAFFGEAIAGAENEAISIQEFVEHIVEECSARQKLAKQGVDRMAKTVAGLTELELKKPEQFDEEIGGVDAQLNAKRQELATLNQTKGGLEAELRELQQRKSRRAAEQNIASDEPKVLKGVEDNENDNKRIMDTLATPMHDFTAEKSALVARRTEAKMHYDATMVRIAELKDKISAAREAIAGANQARGLAQQQMKELDAEMAELLKSPCCPTCDAPGTEWRERIKARFAAKIKASSDSDAGAQDTSVRHASAKAELERALQAEQEKARTEENIVFGIEQEQRALVEGENRTKTERQRLESLARECVTKANALNQLKARIVQAKEFLASSSDESDAALQSQLGDVTHKLTMLRDAIRDIEQSRTRIVASKASAVSQLQAVAERNKAQAELDIWKETIKVVTSFQKRMVDAAFGSMMAVANKFTDGILSSPLQYRDGEIGRQRDGRWVPQDQFSDAEQIVTYAAMSVALAASADFKIVIVDELTRVRGERKAQILERMIELIEDGVIDQFLGVDVQTDDGRVPEYYDNPNLSIIHLK